MDFFKVKTKTIGGNKTDIYPEFKVGISNDLMIRGKSFYALWDEEAGLWSTNEYNVIDKIDRALYSYYEEHKESLIGVVTVRYMRDYSTGSWESWKKYISHLPDSYHQLDTKLTFDDTEVKKNDYVSRRLPYSLKDGPCKAYETLMSTLYSPEEREKIEWAVGSIIAGASKTIQKFIVLYGEAGAGKSTVLNIIQMLFDKYYTTFEAKALTSSNNSFATESFRENPLVAIQHDGDLSKIEDNSKLNSIISHEEILINEKYKPAYPMRINCFLFMATNRPVKITDAKSGIIRRLIDVRPSGNRLPIKKYNSCMDKIPFELGAIASHCLQVYEDLGRSYYNGYIPLEMIYQTDVFFNFVEEYLETFEEENGVSLKRAYTMYKQYCSDTLVPYQMPMYKFREELKNYFDEFIDRGRIDGQLVRSYYHGFLKDKFYKKTAEREGDDILELTFTDSIFDQMFEDAPAQYTTEDEKPLKKWDRVTSKLRDLDTTRVHYVKLPENHIVIDFDLKDESGKKSRLLNLRAASSWPETYAELSKGGSGLHLHYIYTGDPKKLKNVYSPGIEIKTFTGNASLRRRLSLCNNLDIAELSSGLPLKGGKMINLETVKNEQAIRKLIRNNMDKKYHPGTKPSIDFIEKILDDAYKSGVVYDVTDMRSQILAFAMNSTNQKEYCVKAVSRMRFKSENENTAITSEEAPLVFFDVEVFPNLFLLNWKYAGHDKKCVRMINPTPEDIGAFILNMNLVGFNCRRYDNHILYARYLGYSNKDLFNLSQSIVNGTGTYFGEAYNLSYTDVYDFCSKKQSLKKWEIELGIHHQELGLPWDQPVPEEKWKLVSEYCDNDVIATEVVFNCRNADFVARRILAKLSGLSLNDTTNSHSTRIIFGDNKHPQDEFVYTDLSEMFPGYKYENGVSTYRGEKVGEGGYVYSEPGMYYNVPTLDVESMHPTSIEQLGLFGERYTKRFSDLKRARICIKHHDRDSLKNLMDGDLMEFISMIEAGELTWEDLAYALKIVINSIYGLTAASFDNPFRDPRNIDNIVAKRGALFMIDLKYAVQEMGYTVAHIKTDSIKIPNADQKIIDFVKDFGKKYGYNFELETTYEKMCLVNNAVYIAKVEDGGWTTTGAQFQQPYVFKMLFSHEPIEFEDLCETKSVKTALYLDMTGESLDEDANELPFHDYIFVGKVGSFCPMKEGYGGILLREKDGKYYSVTDTKGYLWKEAELVKDQHLEEFIDRSYYDEKVKQAYTDIQTFGDVEHFLDSEELPWCTAVLEDGTYEVNRCFHCPMFVESEEGSYICKKGMLK